ncbi:MAG: T9SS type A sorting domain-containing protein, partial [Bacteroidetes bacterium]|nr:T9SS type A sorting domain-containing protein [Bacteroidota bacterium]
NPEWRYAMNAFKAVGLEVPDQTEPGVKLQPVIGKNFIITKSTGNKKAGVVAYTDHFEEKSNLLNKISSPKTYISSTDNGYYGFYVGYEGQIHKLDFSPINSDTLSESQSLYDSILNINTAINWNSVSVSPDGKKLALTAEPFDGNIYLYDLLKNKLWTYFIAPYYYVQDRNEPIDYPSITSINSLQWNYNGEHILFDCEAKLKNNDHLSNELQYNIGILKIWDSKNNAPDEGEIRAPFGSKKLSYNHYKNPKFAKNRPTLITCDQNNSIQKSNWISIYDDSRPNRGIVKLLESSIVSNPCFTHNDNKIAYTSTTAFGDTAINLVDVNLDSMIILRESQDQIIGKKLPSWLTVGYRIGNSVKEPTKPISSPNIVLFPNPTSNTLNLEFAAGINKVQVINLKGELLLEQWFSNSKLATVRVNELPAGQFVCIIYSHNSVIRRKFVIE